MDGIQQLTSFWIEWQGRALILSMLVILVAAPMHWRSPLWRHWTLVSGALVLLVYPLILMILPRWNLPIIPSYVLLDPFSSPIQFDFSEPQTRIWPSVLLGLSLLVSFLLVSRYLSAWAGLSRRVGEGAAPSAELNALFRECANEVGLDSRNIELLIGAENEVPCTLGWLQPRILLPISLVDSAHGNWTREDRRIVLIHELQHIKRRDWLWQQAMVAMLILYPLNPFAWKMKSLARKLAEESVDKLSLSSNIAPMEYANALLRQLRHCKQMRSNVAVHMYQRLDIVERVGSLISEPYSWQRLGRLSTGQLSFLMLLLALPIAVIEPVSIPGASWSNRVASPTVPDIEPIRPVVEELPIWVPTPSVSPIIDDPAFPPASSVSWQVSVEQSYMDTDLQLTAAVSLPETAIPIEPRPLYLERPTYPALDLRRGREAIVEVVFDLNDQGEVINPRISDSRLSSSGASSKRFEQAVLAAIGASRYQINDPDQRPLIMQDLTQIYVFEVVDDKRVSAPENLSQNPP